MKSDRQEGKSGYAWSSAPDSASSVSGPGLGFHYSDVNPENGYYRSYAFPVCCVQE